MNKDIIKSVRLTISFRLCTITLFQVEVNVLGVINATNAFLPLLRNGVGKKCITLSTGVADLDFTLASEFPALTPYSISKAGTNMVVAKYAVELKQEGFTFVAISPGLVDTSTRPRQLPFSAPTGLRSDEISQRQHKSLSSSMQCLNVS